MIDKNLQIGVIGAGSFGTAIAHHLGRIGYPVTLWSFEKEVAISIQKDRENKKYLPEVKISENITGTSNLAEALESKKLVLQVNPSHAARSVMTQAVEFLSPDTIIVNCTKGIEIDTVSTMSQLLKEILPQANCDRLAFLSGPNFAREVALGQPSATTIASNSKKIASYCQDVFTSESFRVYITDDMVGSELASALKNVIAIAAGISDGMNLGHNTLAALITRGMAEILRLGVKMGAKEMTFLGLSGMGDLVLTCTGDLSRNRRVGQELGRGKSIDEIVESMNMVAEGVKTAKAAHLLAQKHSVEMPITEQVYKVIYEGKDPHKALFDLMTRQTTTEIGAF